MYSSFQEVDGVFKFATANNSKDLEEIQKFLDDAINVIDLCVGYKRGNPSPVLQVFLSRCDELVSRVARKAG